MGGGVLTVDMAAFQGLLNRESVTDGTTRGVYDPRALLDMLQSLLVDQATSALVQWAIDGDNVTLCEHVFQLLHTANFHGLSSI